MGTQTTDGSVTAAPSDPEAPQLFTIHGGVQYPLSSMKLILKDCIYQAALINTSFPF